MENMTFSELVQETSVIEGIIEQCTKKGWVMLKSRKISNNPDDDYLRVVLVKNEKNEYVVYIYNIEFKGFSNGNYYTDMEKALQRWQER